MKYINATRLASKKSYYLPKARTNYHNESIKFRFRKSRVLLALVETVLI